VVPLQPALWLIGNRAGKPAFVEEDVQVVLPEGLAVPDAKEILDFAGLAGLFAELEDLRRDLAGDLAAMESGCAGCGTRSGMPGDRRLSGG
jgi:hypothetical protein